MKSASQFVVVLVTAPSIDNARLLAKTALNEKLVACANLLPQVESHYWWQGKLECSTEVLLLLKTKVVCLKALENLILKHHPYDTPEIITLPLRSGTAKYLDWLTQSVK